READRVADLPDGRRVSPGLHGIPDEVEDPPLPRGGVLHSATSWTATLPRWCWAFKHVFDPALDTEHLFGHTARHASNTRSMGEDAGRGRHGCRRGGRGSRCGRISLGPVDSGGADRAYRARPRAAVGE